MSSPVKKFTAEHIIGLLQKKHAEDIFVPECKNGPTNYGTSHLLKLDAWVMPKSWAHWATIGYEVKVSRHDFEQDQKWVGYLPYCHLFYFVCPGGLIRATDLPPGVGLLWVSQNGERLHVKVRATKHEPDQDKLRELMKYVLMSRTRIDPEVCETKHGLDRIAQMRQWAEEAAAKQDLSWFVRHQIRARLAEADAKLSHAESLVKLADAFRAKLARLGIVWNGDAGDWSERNRVEREIDQLLRNVDWHDLSTIEQGARRMLEATEAIRRLRRQAEQEDAVQAKAGAA